MSVDRHAAPTLSVAVDTPKLAVLASFPPSRFLEQSGGSEEPEIDDSELKKGLERIWFATGKEDFLIRTSQRTVEVLKDHGFDVTYKETAGGHTWINWRQYLSEFAQLLFQQP